MDFKRPGTKRTAAGNNSQVVKLGINEDENISQVGHEKISLEIKRKFYYTAIKVTRWLYIYINASVHDDSQCYGRREQRKSRKKASD